MTVCSSQKYLYKGAPWKPLEIGANYSPIPSRSYSKHGGKNPLCLSLDRYREMCIAQI